MITIQKIAIGQGDDCTTGCLLDCNYFKNYYKMIAIDLSKPQALDADPKAMQKINFTGNLNQGDIANDNTTTFFITEEGTGVFQVFHKEIWKYYNFILFYYHINSTQYNTLNVKLFNQNLKTY